MNAQPEADSKRKVSFATPDSGIDCSGSHFTAFASQDSFEARTSYGYNFENKQTPKSRKRRRRDGKQALMPTEEQLTSTPYFENSTQLQFRPQFDTSLASHSAEFVNESSTSLHYDSGIGSSFNTEADQSANSFGATKGGHSTELQNDAVDDDDEEELDAEKENERATGRRRRRTKIVRPNEEEYNEKVAAKLVGRLVIKQSVPKYRITYSEILRRVSPPELFNVSALITLFRIKKDAESSKKIMSVLKELNYDLKKGRRMNRNVTRFSAFVEEEAMETGRDLERINKAYTPVEAVNSVFIQNQKSYCQPNALIRKLQNLRAFYGAAKRIFESDQTPLAFHRAPPNAIALNPGLQKRLEHLTWITHGFSLTAYSGLASFLQDMTESALHYGFKEMATCEGDSLGRTEISGSSFMPVPSLIKSDPCSVPAGQWPAFQNSTSAGSSYNESCRVVSQASFPAESSSCRQFGTSINGPPNPYSGRFEEPCNFFSGYSEPERFNASYRMSESSGSAGNYQYYQPGLSASNTSRDGYAVPYPLIPGCSGSERFTVSYQPGNSTASAMNSFGCYRPQRFPNQYPGYY